MPTNANPNLGTLDTHFYDPLTASSNIAEQAGTVSTGSDGTKYAPGVVTISNANPNGQNTMVNSAPVAWASNQTPLVMATPTVTQVASSATSVTILALNAARKGLLLFNDSNAILYLLYGAGAASATNYSVKIPAQGLWELPPMPVYTGAFTGIWSAANGFAYVTEVV